MSDNNGWLGKPGVPLNPKKSRYHWVVFPKTKHWPQGKIQIGRWCAEEETWEEISDCSLSPADLANWRYLGPCLTPAEVDARVKEARRDALEEAALAAENEPEPEGDPPPELHGRSVKNIAIASVRATKRSIAAAIRALKGEGDE
jgi:hypothetical protein